MGRVVANSRFGNYDKDARWVKSLHWFVVLCGLALVAIMEFATLPPSGPIAIFTFAILVFMLCGGMILTLRYGAEFFRSLRKR